MTVLVVVLLCTWAGKASDGSYRLSCSDRYWYPFLYTQEDRVKGILYDIVNKAFESLGIETYVEPVPYKRALVYAQKGKVDALFGIGFRAELSRYLDYPPAAGSDVESQWRILQVDYVVVTFIENDYEFEGDLRSLPVPVRIPQGAPIIDKLDNAGIRSQELRRSMQNFLQLIRDKKGVVIATSVTSEIIARDPRFEGKIKIHATPIASHSCHLAFSKKSRFSASEKERIWKEMARWRDDYVFMLQVFSQY